MDFEEKIIIALFWCPHCQKDVRTDEVRHIGTMLSPEMITWQIKHKICQQDFLFSIDVKSCSTFKEGVHIDLQKREVGDHLR